MASVLLAIGALGALVVASGIGAAESALSAVSRARVEEMVDNDVAGAPQLMRVLGARNEHINLLVLARTMLEALASVCTAMLCFQLIPSPGYALLAAVAVLSLVSYVIIGVASRSVGRNNPYSFALNSAIVLSVIRLILGPISRVLVWLGRSLASGENSDAGPYATELELREMVDMAQASGVVELEERRMLQNVFDLQETIARSVMVPRPEMIWIEAGKTAGQATALCVRSGHSRIPVIGESVEDIRGVVFLKDLVQRTYHSTDSGRSVLVDEVMRPAMFVPDSKNLDDLLQDMQRDRFHIAMVVDEYGGIAGLLSIEDILEEIVGEIADEYDQGEIAPIQQLDQRTYRVHSRLNIEELEELVLEQHGQDLHLSEEVLDQVDTVGGLIAFELGRVPLPGATVQVNNLTLTSEGERDRRGRMRMTSVVVAVAEEEPAATYDERDEDSAAAGLA